MKKQILKSLLIVGITSISAMGCNGNNSSSSNTPTPVNGPCGSATCSTPLTPESFVAGLIQLAKSGAIAASYANSAVLKDLSEQNNYFVIWDGARNQPEAVNTGLLQQITFQNGAVVSTPEGVSFGGNGGADANAATSMGGNTVFTGFSYECGGWCTQTYPFNSVVLLKADGTTTNGNPQFVDSAGNLFDNPTQVRDTSLQLSQADQQEIIKNAATLSLGMQMSYGSAVKLSLINQQAKQILANRSVTDADRASITNQILKAGNVTGEQINEAFVAGIQGDDSKASALTASIAKSLGMSSDTNLRTAFSKLGMPLN